MSAIDYDLIAQVTGIIFADRSISDGRLQSQALELLQVLDHPKFAFYNLPNWIKHSSYGFLDQDELTVRGVLNAMHHTAAEMHMQRGQRYVSAAICACARLAAVNTSDTGALPQHRSMEEERLAANLGYLATSWIAYLIWPFVTLNLTYSNHWSGWTPTSPTAGGTWTGRATPLECTTPIAEHRNINEIVSEDLVVDLWYTSFAVDADYNCVARGHTIKDVARREKYMCCVSGSVQPCLKARKVHGQYIEAIDQQASRIVKLAALKSHGKLDPEDAESEARSRQRTFDILQHFCELPDDFFANSAKIEGATNCLLINIALHLPFQRHEWSLRPVNHADRDNHTYRIVMHADHDFAGLRHSQPRTITFVDHSAEVDAKSAEFDAKHGIPLDDSECDRLGGPVSLPDRDLLRINSAIASVKYLSRSFYVFEWMESRACREYAWRCDGSDDDLHGSSANDDEIARPPLPGLSGASFMKWVADTESWVLKNKGVQADQLG